MFGVWLLLQFACFVLCCVRLFAVVFGVCDLFVFTCSGFVFSGLIFWEFWFVDW